MTPRRRSAAPVSFAASQTAVVSACATIIAPRAAPAVNPIAFIFGMAANPVFLDADGMTELMRHQLHKAAIRTDLMITDADFIAGGAECMTPAGIVTQGRGSVRASEPEIAELSIPAETPFHAPVRAAARMVVIVRFIRRPDRVHMRIKKRHNSTEIRLGARRAIPRKGPGRRLSAQINAKKCTRRHKNFDCHFQLPLQRQYIDGKVTLA